MKRFGFIGMGNMAGAMLKGMLRVFSPDELMFAEKNEEQGKRVEKETGVEYAVSNRSCSSSVKYLILAVKPQFMPEVLEEIKEEIKEEQIVISIAAGVTIADIKEVLGADARVVRVMPNTPALLGEGMTGVCYDASAYSDEERSVIRQIFESFGKMQVVNEALMNAVICVSGSSPAYVYMFIEALADGAVKYGIPRKAAYEMAAQTVLGAAKMVLETGKHPGELKDMVCSPAGTTMAGVAALEEYGFRNSIIKACDSCYEKAESMSRK